MRRLRALFGFALVSVALAGGWLVRSRSSTVGRPLTSQHLMDRRCRGGCTGGALLWLLRGGPSASQVAAGSLLTSSGAAVTTTRASNKSCAFASVSTQLLSSYNAVDTSPWTAGSLGGPAAPVVTANQAVDPFGVTTADKVDFAALAAGTASSVNQDFTTTGTDSYTFSSYVKTVSGTSTVAVYVDGQFNSALTFWTTLCVANSSTWTRCQATTPVLPAGTFHVFVGYDSRDSAQASVFPVAAQSFYVADSKLEKGTAATPVAGTILSANQPCVDTVGLNVEGSATNQLLQSQTLDNAAWIKGGSATVTADQSIAPDGTLTADKVALTTGAGTDFVHQTAPGAYESQTHTVSAWVRSATGSNQSFRLKLTHAAVSDHFSSDLTATTTWQRFTFTQAFPATVGTGATCGVVADVAGDATQVYVWGMQLEKASSFATSYIATTGTTATRAVDVVSLANPLPAGSSTYCLSALATPEAPWSAFTTTGTNMILIGVGGAFAANSITSWVVNGNSLHLDVFDSAGTDFGFSTSILGVSGSTPGQIKGCRTGSSTWYASTNGVALTPNLAASGNAVVQPATMYLGSNNGSNPFFGWLSNICVSAVQGACP